jgi:L-asparaginase
MTGGTIDKVYNTSTGELTFVKTHIIDMLNRSRSMVDTLSEVLFLATTLHLIYSIKPYLKNVTFKMQCYYCRVKM